MGSSDSSKIFFPEDIEDMVAKFASKIKAETTTTGDIQDDDANDDLDKTTEALTTTSKTIEETFSTQVQVVQVEAENVNGPSELDNVDAINEADNEIEDDIRSAKETEETANRDTTVINGFVIKKNIGTSVSNDIETVRTGPVIEVEEVVEVTSENIIEE